MNNFVNKLKNNQSTFFIYDNRISENYEINDIVLSKNGIIDIFYPIGSIYITINATFNPNTSFGGSWEKIEEKILFGSGKYLSGKAGGEFEHTLTIDEMPSHSHDFIGEAKTISSTSIPAWSGPNFLGIIGQFDDGHTYNISSTQYNTADTNSIKIATSGNSTPFNVMPPYLVVNIWKRIG